MISVRIRVIGAGPIIARYQRAPQEADRAMRLTNQEMTRHMVTTLRKHTPVGATGQLRASTKGFLVKTPMGYQSQIVQDARSAGGHAYQQGVNDGTSPHFPPPAALVAWVKAKWGLTGQAAVRGAWALAVHISRVGTRPNPYIQRAMVAARPGLRDIGRRMGTRFRTSMTRG